MIKSIGYEQDTFHWENAKIDINLHAQSPDISIGVDAKGNNEEVLVIKELCLDMQQMRQKL